jgi:hypothetical protein
MCIQKTMIYNIRQPVLLRKRINFVLSAVNISVYIQPPLSVLYCDDAWLLLGDVWPLPYWMQCNFVCVCAMWV